MATFVYCIVTLVSIGPGDNGDFVPHISITTAFGLVLIDVMVLIYFIHHIATQIQLPQVIAGIARDLARAVAAQSEDQPEFATRDPALGPTLDELLSRIETAGTVIPTPKSGYLQFIRHQTLVRVAAQADAVIRLPYRPGHFLVEGRELASVWPETAAERVADYLARAQATGPHRTLTQDVAFGVDQLVEIAIRALSPAVNDTFTALTCIDWLGDCLQNCSDMGANSSASRPPRRHSRHLRSSQLRAAGATIVREDPAGRPRHAGGDGPSARCVNDDHGANDRPAARPSPDGSGGHDSAFECGIGFRTV